jgi:hypothetical protein
MIRPLTIVTFLMASGSGLYLYQSKHEVQLLDRTIERTVHETSALRDQSRLLVAEWTMLNDPERLRQFSDTYLSLKTITPAQFSSLADLDNRLPAVKVEPPHVEEAPVVAETVPQAVPVVGDTVAGETPSAPVEAEEVLPVPPLPVAARPVAVAVARPVERVVERPLERPLERKVAAVKPPEVSPPRLMATAEPRPVEQRTQRVPENRPAEARAAEARAPEYHVAVAPRPAPVQVPRPAPYTPPPSATVAAAAPYGGSLLGMARGSLQPAPRPTPVNATQWSNTN